MQISTVLLHFYLSSPLGRRYKSSVYINADDLTTSIKFKKGSNQRLGRMTDNEDTLVGGKIHGLWCEEAKVAGQARIGVGLGMMELK